MGFFRKLGVPYLGVLKNKDPTIYGTILGSPIVGNSHIEGLRMHETAKAKRVGFAVCLANCSRTFVTRRQSCRDKSSRVEDVRIGFR